MDWTAVTAVATVISMLAYIITALYVRAELKALEKDRYLAVTGELFAIWASKDFMEAQLWLLHRLDETTWHQFVSAHRGSTGEAAFHRVGAFYNRVGTLVRLGLVNEGEILSTVGAHAIAVWQKVQPLVKEARRLEHSTLFTDFEQLLPACYECYVPTLGAKPNIQPFALLQPIHSGDAEVPRTSLAALRSMLAKKDPPTVLDVRSAAVRVTEPAVIPHAVVMAPDEVEERFRELPVDREVVVYCA